MTDLSIFFCFNALREARYCGSSDVYLQVRWGIQAKFIFLCEIFFFFFHQTKRQRERERQRDKRREREIKPHKYFNFITSNESSILRKLSLLEQPHRPKQSSLDQVANYLISLTVLLLLRLLGSMEYHLGTKSLYTKATICS